MGFEIGEGESVCLFGPSGAGKTTLLRMLAGLIRPDSGRIEVDGQTWFDSAGGIDLPPQRRRAGLVFQDYALFPNMTVRGNLAYALPRGSPASRIDELLEAIGLSGLSDRNPDTLSGGQKQRVAVARALVSNPRILLLDEPLSALDQAMRAQLQDEIAALQARYRLATVLVSHDRTEILRLAGRIACVDEGRIVRQGAPAEVFGQDSAGNESQRHAVVLSVVAAGAMRVVTVLAGSETVRVNAQPQEAEGLKPGDTVFLGAAYFLKTK